MDRHLINKRVLAETCGVSIRTVTHWLTEGLGPKPIRLPGRLVRWDPTEVASWLDSQQS